MPDPVTSNKFRSYSPIFVRPATPILDLFPDIHHGLILYHKRKGGAMNVKIMGVGLAFLPLLGRILLFHRGGHKDRLPYR